jgi:hypothetical protein
MVCTGAKFQNIGVTIFIFYNKPNVVAMEIMLNACELIGLPALIGNTFAL